MSFDLSQLTNMLGDLQNTMDQAKETAAAVEVEATAGGMVTVVATGAAQLKSITIDDSAMDDRELLEDLLRAAANQALSLAQDEAAKEMANMTAGLNLPPGMLPGQ